MSRYYRTLVGGIPISNVMTSVDSHQNLTEAE